MFIQIVSQTWALLSFVPPGWGANSSQSSLSYSFSGHKQRCSFVAFPLPSPSSDLKVPFNEAWSYIKRLESEVKSSQQMSVKVVLGKLTSYFLRLIFNVRVNNRRFWQFRFHGVHFNHDSQNSFSVHHYSRTSKIVDHGITKISLAPSIKTTTF